MMDPDDILGIHEQEQMEACLRKIAHHVAYYRAALEEGGMCAEDALAASDTLALFLLEQTIDVG
jgi:hypothetical protein